MHMVHASEAENTSALCAFRSRKRHTTINFVADALRDAPYQPSRCARRPVMTRSALLAPLQAERRAPF